MLRSWINQNMVQKILKGIDKILQYWTTSAKFPGEVTLNKYQNACEFFPSISNKNCI